MRQNQAEEYLSAAKEHFAELQILAVDEVRHYPSAFYLSGVAVECLFRAYVAMTQAPFDDKHDLRQLAVSGKFLECMPHEEMLQANLQAAIIDVYTRWSNSFRYCSTSGLRRKLNQKNLFRRGAKNLRGDIVKANWEILFTATDILMTAGVERWEFSKKKWNV